MQIDLPFGETRLTLTVPDGRSIEVRPTEVKAASDPAAAIAFALDNPIGTARLDKLAQPGQRVAVIVDDLTRPTPVPLLLSAVLARLEKAGVRPENITLVLALGTHRLMTGQEIERHLGREVVRRYRVVSASAFDTEQLIEMGVSTSGIPIQINRHVVEADLRVAIGNIVPHPDAGWGGGAKIICPGVAGRKTIEALHVKVGHCPPFALANESAPMRLEIEALVSEIGLDFIVNTILTGQGQIYRVVAGDFIQAHRVGVSHALEVYGIPVSTWSDVVVVSSYPMDLDFWQATKAVFAGVRILRPGGRLLLAAPCPEGVGPNPKFAEYVRLPYAELSAQIEQGIEDPIAAGGALQLTMARQLFRISVFSPGLDPALIRAMGFEALSDLQRSVDALDHGSQIAVITHGGESCPFVVGE